MLPFETADVPSETLALGGLIESAPAVSVTVAFVAPTGRATSAVVAVKAVKMQTTSKGLRIIIWSFSLTSYRVVIPMIGAREERIDSADPDRCPKKGHAGRANPGGLVGRQY
jgi:hypothetical protein